MILVCAYICIPLVQQHTAGLIVGTQYGSSSVTFLVAANLKGSSCYNWPHGLCKLCCAAVYMCGCQLISRLVLHTAPRSIYRVWFCFHSAISRALPIQLQLLMIQWVSVWFASLHWQGTTAPIWAIKARQSGWQLLMRLMRTDSNQPLSMCGYFLCPHSLSLSYQCVGFYPILVQFLKANQITLFFFQHLLGYYNNFL